MKRICPTIHELLAFEASARHLSFTDAADELCITPSAVSRQVSSLEEFLGVALFRRSGKKLVLSGNGKMYLSKVAPGLNIIKAASLDMLAVRSCDSSLTLSSVPTFTTNWLIPHWPLFQQIYPDAKLNFKAHVSSDEMFPPDVTAAVRFGKGTWPNVVSEYLIGNRFVVICRPEDLKGERAIRGVNDIHRHTLLQHIEAPGSWERWCDHVKIDKSRALLGPRFEQYSVLISAVVNGMGIGLVPEFLVGQELKKGLLVKPFSTSVEINQGHYLCYPKEQLNLPVFKAFRTWLQTACADPRDAHTVAPLRVQANTPA